MKFFLLLLTIFALIIPGYAATSAKAKVVSVKKYSNGRIAYWEGSIPIHDNRPVYDITIQFENKLYVVRYESFTGYYPSAWKAGNEIDVKKERGQFVLMNGEEEITARTVVQHDCIPYPSPTFRKSPGLPCE